MITPHDSPPFDINDVPLTVFDSPAQYLEFCRQRYFADCYQKTVLEIGPYNGDHSRQIVASGAARLQVVESNQAVIQNLESIPGIDRVIQDDAMLWLQHTREFDVVVCFGVLYHLHSPLHLLELIVNNCDAHHIMLDCVMSSDQLQFLPEDLHVHGNRQTRPQWRACRLNLVAPFLTYLQAMDHMGYQCIEADRISVKNYFPKSHSWIAKWEKKNDRS